MRALLPALLLVPFTVLSLAPPSASAEPPYRPVLDEPGFAPGGGDLSVTLSGRTERSELGSGVSGFVALAVPLDRLAAPRRLAASAGDAPRAGEAPEQQPAEAASRQPDAPKAEPSDEPALPAGILARLARDAVRAALRAHDVSLRRSELDGLGTRARLSAALPELRLRAVGSNDQSQRLTPTIEDPERYTITGGNDLLLEASATWKLNRLIFADEEIAVERLALEREKNTEKLSERVVERLFDWHRALSGLAARNPDPKKRGPLELERLEAEVELDVLTGGWFSGAARQFPVPRRTRDDYERDDSTSSSSTSPSSTRTPSTPSQ